MIKELNPDFCFRAFVPRDNGDTAAKLQNIGTNPVKKKFSPEFVNRIDSVVIYEPLTQEALATILDRQLFELQQQILTRLGERAFRIPPKTRRFLLTIRTPEEYGTRELKRTLERHLIQPLAVHVAAGEIPPGAIVRAELTGARTKVTMRIVDDDVLAPAG